MENLREISRKTMKINSPQGGDARRIEVSDVAGVRIQLVIEDLKERDLPRRSNTYRHNLMMIVGMTGHPIVISLQEQVKRVLRCIRHIEELSISES